MPSEPSSNEPDSGSGTMTLILFLTVLWGVVGLFLYKYTRTTAQEEQEASQARTSLKRDEPKKEKKKRGGMGRVGRGGNDVQEARPANTTQGADEEEDDANPVLSRKEQRAKDKRDAKNEARQEREEAEEKKRDKQSMRNAKYEQRDREREEMEAKLEQEEAEREAERQREAEAELAKWRGMFSVGDSGTEADMEASEAQGKLGEFIEFIEAQKVVAMEDLAAHFEMRPQDVLKRIEDLMAIERLSGVIDDRGKFIVITPEEMKAVAKFMRRRGRVNVTDLAAESNKLIDLTPKPPTQTPAVEATA